MVALGRKHALSLAPDTPVIFVPLIRLLSFSSPLVGLVSALRSRFYAVA